MIKKLVWGIIAILWFFIATFLYNKYSPCCSCKTECDTRKIDAAPLALADTDWSYSFNENFKFKAGSAEPIVGAAMNTGLDSLAMHLATAKPTHTTTLTGYYNAEEKNDTKFENLGIARAEAVKSILVQKGVPAGNIFTSGALNSAGKYTMSADTLYGGVDFGVQLLDTGKMVELKEDVLIQPRTVYFETGKNSIIITDELNNYLLNAEKYLATHTDKKLLLTGHTDNVGDPAKNAELSKERAGFVKAQLEKRSIAAAQIETEGKGDAVPIADNATEEGRAQNRRVEIKIQ